MSYNQSIKVKPPNTMPLGGKQDGTVLREGVTVFGGGGGGIGGLTVHREKTGERIVARYLGGHGILGAVLGGFTYYSIKSKSRSILSKLRHLQDTPASLKLHYFQVKIKQLQNCTNIECVKT